jgi:hypothetical protein
MRLNKGFFPRLDQGMRNAGLRATTRIALAEMAIGVCTLLYNVCWNEQDYSRQARLASERESKNECSAPIVSKC